MPTRSGWLLVVSSVVVGLGGRLLGLPELFLVATAGVALVAASVAFVRLRGCALEARRHLTPGRVGAGGTCRVALTVANVARFRSPALHLVDGATGRFRVAPLPPGGAVDCSYPFEAGGRGLVTVGPLRASVGDPFGLASRTTDVLGPSTLVVHPAVEEVGLPEPRAATGSAPRPAPGRVPGGDFHALRPYQEGDDLRLVHWPTSARLDELVVRQDEAPRPRRMVVALDLRAAVHDVATLERAVSVAASLVASACATEGTVRLLASGGFDTGRAGGEGHLAAVLDRLAAVGTTAERSHRALAVHLADEEDADAVVVTTDAGVGDLGALTGALTGRAADAAGCVVVVVQRALQRPGRGSPAAFPVVTVPPGASFRPAWERSVAGADR